MQDDPKIAIIILNWNGKKDTLECLSSVAKINYKNFETIVVDNGSSDDSVAAIKNDFPNIEIIETKENLGFAEGNNVGIRHALAKGADALLLLNNDTIVDPNLLQGFANAGKDKEIGVIGAKIYLYYERDKLDHLGGMWNAKRAAFDFIGHGESGDNWMAPVELDYVCGAAFYVKREVFEKIGFLESQFFLIWEESDFCFRARNSGYKVTSCPDAKIWHKVSASFVGKPHTNYFWWRNRLLWMQRNLKRKERAIIYTKVIIPEITKIYKLNLLNKLQLFFTEAFTNKDSMEKRKKILKNQAALQGVSDFFSRKFGQGPSWIYRPPSEKTSVKK